VHQCEGIGRSAVPAVQHILPERLALVADLQRAQIAAAAVVQADVEQMRRRDVELRRREAGWCRLRLKRVVRKGPPLGSDCAIDAELEALLIDFAEVAIAESQRQTVAGAKRAGGP